jgi:hypothetical protein
MSTQHRKLMQKFYYRGDYWYQPVHVLPLQLFKHAQLATPLATLHVPPFSHGLFVHGETEIYINVTLFLQQKFPLGCKVIL